MTETTETVAAVFLRLRNQWKKETCYVSSTTQLVQHEAYQQIIGLGPAVVPLLLAELQGAPDWWFAALQSITNENPAQPTDAGRLEALTQAWLAWGRAKGLI